MNTKRTLFVVMLVLIGALTAHGQVSIDSTTSFTDAIKGFEKLSGKIIVDPYRYTSPVGVTIINKSWREALEMILRVKGLSYDDQPSYILLTQSSLSGPVVPTGDKVAGAAPVMKKYPGIDSRQILISRITVTLNIGKSQEYGLGWMFSFLSPSALRPAGVQDTLNVTGQVGQLASPVGGINLTASRPFPGGSINGLLNFIAKNNIGDVISSQKMLIPEGDSAVVQIGTDVSIPKKDIGIGGQTTISVDLVPTGSILKATPHIFKVDGIEYVYVEFKSDQSSLASTDPDHPAISRNTSTQSILAVNGEEMMVSGNSEFTESNTRTGVPVLKDLPWWFLGLRYIFGSDQTVMTKTQIVQLFKVEVLPSVRERAKLIRQESDLDKTRKEMDNEIEKMKTKKEDKEKE